MLAYDHSLFLKDFKAHYYQWISTIVYWRLINTFSLRYGLLSLRFRDLPHWGWWVQLEVGRCLLCLYPCWTIHYFITFVCSLGSGNVLGAFIAFIWRWINPFSRGIRLSLRGHYNELSKIWILSQLQIYNSSSCEKHNTNI